MIKKFGRMAFFVVLYLVWPLLKHILRPDLVFLVYGTDADKRLYWPKWAEKYFRKVFPIGIIRCRGLWGFVGATLVTAEEMEKNPEKVLGLLAATKREFPQARAFALAGRLPGFIHKVGQTVEKPFVEGLWGTRYAMYSAAKALAEKLGQPSTELCLALLGGAGYIGSWVVEDLSVEFRKVIAFDLCYEGMERVNENIFYSAAPVDLIWADVALVLTSKGDNMRGLAQYFHRGVHIADDTHPPIHRAIRQEFTEEGAFLWKATMAGGGRLMFPRLPNFRPDDIPGCLLEALVVLLAGEEALQSQERFNQVAKEMGFKARLEKHSDDS